MCVVSVLIVIEGREGMNRHSEHSVLMGYKQDLEMEGHNEKANLES